MKKIFKVLATGGIGSGKSTVCRLFEENHQIPVFYADYHAALIMNNNKKVVKDIKEAFGEDLYENDNLNRKALADIVFNDPEKLELINSIVHSAVREKFEKWCYAQELLQKNLPYVIEEAAIAIELGIQDEFDYIIVVTADEDIRIERVMKRDNCTEEKVRDRMRNQLSEQEKIKHADAVINNDNFPNIECQVKDVNEKILKETT